MFVYNSENYSQKEKTFLKYFNLMPLSVICTIFLFFYNYSLYSTV